MGLSKQCNLCESTPWCLVLVTSPVSVTARRGRVLAALQPAPSVICAVMSASERNPEQCLILHIKSAFAHISATTALCVQIPVVPPRPVEISNHHLVNRFLPPPDPSHAPQTNLPKCFQNKRKSSKGLVEEAAHCPVSLPGRPPSPGPPSASPWKHHTANQTALDLRHRLQPQTSQSVTDTVIIEGLATAQLPGLDGRPSVKNILELVRHDPQDSLNFTQNPAKINENVRNGGLVSKSLGQEKPCDQLPSSCVLQSDTCLKNAARENNFLLNSEKFPNCRRQCKSKVSILEEVLSWRRTANQSPPRTCFERPRNNVIQQSFKRKPLIIPNRLSSCFFRSILLLISLSPC